MTDELITFDELWKVIDSLPDEKMNPTEEGSNTCFYTSYDDPSHHCIAGEIVTRFGWELPDVYESSNSASFLTLYDDFNYPITGQMASMLTDLQAAADSQTNKGNRFAWGHAKEEVRLNAMAGIYEDE